MGRAPGAVKTHPAPRGARAAMLSNQNTCQIAELTGASYAGLVGQTAVVHGESWFQNTISLYLSQ